MNTCTRSVSIMSPFSILSGSWSCMSMDLTVRYKCDHVILYDTTSGHAWLDIIIITIISKVQIVKKLSALYKEYDGSWLMYMYVKKSNKKAKIKHIPHGVTLTHPLSLYTHPHPPTHPPPHTHHAHIKSNRAELIRVIQVEEMCLQRGLESSDCCSISNVWWQWVPDRKAKIRDMKWYTVYMWLDQSSTTKVKWCQKKL